MKGPLHARGAPPPGGVSTRLEGAGRAEPRSGEHGPGEAERHLTHVTDSVGELASSQRFHAYGKAWGRRGVAPSRGCIGKDREVDEELGLLRFGARWYAPELGGLVTADPLRGQHPALVAGRVRERDPYGHDARGDFHNANLEFVQGSDALAEAASTLEAGHAGRVQMHACNTGNGLFLPGDFKRVSRTSTHSVDIGAFSDQVATLRNGKKLEVRGGQSWADPPGDRHLPEAGGVE